MSPKRPNEQSSEDRPFRERKKQKLNAARTIDVQVPSGPSNANPTAGPGPTRSKAVRFDSSKGLPSSLDVEKFTEARAYEIGAMQRAMKSASSASTHRAWQELPRKLRRRAASHDVRRVPARLRGKARAEMDPMRRKILGRKLPKLGKARRESRADIFERRQKDKKWLESHLWHAKRMHMENMWGYRLAIQPTEKSFRPSHRASVHDSILHDASYDALIELKGAQVVLKSLLESVCDLQGQGPGARRYITGARTCDIKMYRPRQYPFGFIGPAVVMWRPRERGAAQNEEGADEGEHHASPKNSPEKAQRKPRRKRGKRKQDVPESAPQPVTPLAEEDTERTVWVRCHPSIFTDVHAALKLALSLTLQDLKSNAKSSNKHYEVEITDLCDSVNVFEITGPKSSQIIRGAFRPVMDGERAELKEFWKALKDLQSPGSVPKNMTIGFEIHDPRLNFPPKNAKVHVSSSRLPSIPAPWTCFPTASLSTSDLWNLDKRRSLQVPRFKKNELDARRSQNVVPGTPLNPTSSDSKIPIIMIQRSLSSSDSMTSPSNATSATSFASSSSHPALHGWTIMFPRGWSIPFLTSLVYTGTRVAGQREIQHQHFESSVPFFPRDFPFSGKAYEEFRRKRETEERERWERKPKAKRASWEKLGTRSAWREDWEVVLGLEEPKSGSQDESEDKGEDGDAMDVDKPGLMSTQREAPPNAQSKPQAQNSDVRPWLLQGSEVPSILTTAFQSLNPSFSLLTSIKQLRSKRGMDPIPPSPVSDLSARLTTSISEGALADDLMNGALVQVRLNMLGRGCPEDLAIIYDVDEKEARKWVIASRKAKKGQDWDMDGEQNTTQLSEEIPSQGDIIGYVTSGNYSLSRGEAFAIGCIPLVKLLELKQRAQKLKLEGMMVKVRDRGETICRAAWVEVLGV